VDDATLQTIVQRIVAVVPQGSIRIYRGVYCQTPSIVEVTFRLMAVSNHVLQSETKLGNMLGCAAPCSRA
jgi:hypothetical protein